VARRALALTFLGLALVVCVAFGASESLTNRTGRTATAVTVTFSEQVRITSYDESVFPTKEPSSRSQTFLFSGRQLENGARFSISWTPSTAEITNTEWETAGAANAVNTLPANWDVAYSYDRDFYVGGWVCDYLANKIWGGAWSVGDPLQTMKENGFEWVKVALTTVSSADLRTTPSDRWSALPWRNEYWSSLEYDAEILRQAAAKGLRLNVVLYLSDDSAHAGKQPLAADWKGLSIEALEAKIEEYCYATAVYFAERGLNIEIWDIGNEIEWGVAGYRVGQGIPVPAGVDVTSDMSFMSNHVWNLEAGLLSAGIRGLRRAAPSAKIVLHVNSVELNPEIALTFFRTMLTLSVDFDYAGLSLPYPSSGWRLASMSKTAWYQKLEETIQSIAAVGKDVIISEGAYPSTSTGFACSPMPDYPFSPEGQAAWVHDTLRFARNSPHVRGFFYFYPDWYPGMNRDVSPDIPGYGLFAASGVPKPAMSEFRVNLSSGP
jgi:arabinogalactan endo-1,4-beta-galactosidase